MEENSECGSYPPTPMPSVPGAQRDPLCSPVPSPSPPFFVPRCTLGLPGSREPLAAVPSRAHVAGTAPGVRGSGAHRAAPAQVLQGGGLESPTKPKGRPKKNSIPTSEQLSEQERAKEAEKPEKPAEAPGEASDKGRED